MLRMYFQLTIWFQDLACVSVSNFSCLYALVHSLRPVYSVHCDATSSKSLDLQINQTKVLKLFQLVTCSWTLRMASLGTFVIADVSYLLKFFFSNATTCPLRLRGPPRLWLECNRLLRLGRPVGAITLSRWEWWWNERWIWGARGGLKPNFYQLPRPWSPWASSPFNEKRTW